VPAADTAALVVRAQRGDRAAFDALVRAHLRTAYSVALGVVGRPADAEDVAQDAMVIALERIDTCRDPARFPGWLVQIVRNQSKNWLDRRRLRDVPADQNPTEQADHTSWPDVAGEKGRLLQALGRLSPVARQVVLLHDLEGWTHAEVASSLGISEVMSRQHLFLARRELRSQLDGQAVVGGSP